MREYFWMINSFVKHFLFFCKFQDSHFDSIYTFFMSRSTFEPLVVYAENTLNMYK